MLAEPSYNYLVWPTECYANDRTTGSTMMIKRVITNLHIQVSSCHSPLWMCGVSFKPHTCSIIWRQINMDIIWVTFIGFSLLWDIPAYFRERKTWCLQNMIPFFNLGVVLIISKISHFFFNLSLHSNLPCIFRGESSISHCDLGI